MSNNTKIIALIEQATEHPALVGLLNDMVLITATQAAESAIESGAWLDYLLTNGWTLDQIADHIDEAFQ